MQPQTLPHLFYRCSVIYNFWFAFQNWWLGTNKNRINVTESNIFYGWHDDTTESKDILNYVILVAKYDIFCTIQESDEVPFNGFPSLLKNKLVTLLQIAVKNKISNNFTKNWKGFMRILFSTSLVMILFNLWY